MYGRSEVHYEKQKWVSGVQKCKSSGLVFGIIAMLIGLLLLTHHMIVYEGVIMHGIIDHGFYGIVLLVSGSFLTIREILKKQSTQQG